MYMEKIQLQSLMLKHQHLARRMTKVEQFHDDIERTMADTDSKYKIITGDFNTKIALLLRPNFQQKFAF